MSMALDSADLYQDVILDHGRCPRNRRKLADGSHQGHGEDPSCGDQLYVYLKTDREGVIRDAAFDGQSCAVATASASLMTEVLVGKTLAQAKSLSDWFHALASGGVEAPWDGMEIERERLMRLAGLRDYPARRKCALLAWHALLAALDCPQECVCHRTRNHEAKGEEYVQTYEVVPPPRRCRLRASRPALESGGGQ
jgi:nitrogen fixation NifU-like protein